MHHRAVHGKPDASKDHRFCNAESGAGQENRAEHKQERNDVEGQGVMVGQPSCFQGIAARDSRRRISTQADRRRDGGILTVPEHQQMGGEQGNSELGQCRGRQEHHHDIGGGCGDRHAQRIGYENGEDDGHRYVPHGPGVNKL